MKTQIEHAVRVLVGMPLWSAGRAGSLEWFHFGTQHEIAQQSGGIKIVGTYALHVQCAWHISGPSGIIVGSTDRYFAAGADPFKGYPDFDWDRLGANRCDELVAALFAARASDLPVVEAIQADNVGTVRLLMSGELNLAVFPDTSLEGEHWRLFQPALRREHIIVTGRGIET